MSVCLVAQFLSELGFVRILIFLDYRRKCICILQLDPDENMHCAYLGRPCVIVNIQCAVCIRALIEYRLLC